MNIHDDPNGLRSPFSSSAKQVFSETEKIKLAEVGNTNERVELATNSDLPHILQTILLQDKEESVLAALAGNPSLNPDSQESLYCTGIISVQKSLASNRNLSEKLMKVLAGSDFEDVRVSLASNASLPESLQACLIADGSIGVRINAAKNSALTIAQQKQVSRTDNVDIRLALLDNPSLDELVIRNRVVASFTRSDLSSVEHDIDAAERKSSKLYSEHKEAFQKCVNSYGVIFPSSDEKIEKLTKEVDRIQNQINAIDREINTLKVSYHKIFRCLYPEADTPPV